MKRVKIEYSRMFYDYELCHSDKEYYLPFDEFKH